MMRDENVSAKGEETTYIHSIQNTKTFPSSLFQLLEHSIFDPPRNEQSHTLHEDTALISSKDSKRRENKQEEEGMIQFTNNPNALR